MKKASARTKAYLALSIATLIWGASQPIIKPALEFITPMQFLFARFLLAAPLTIPFIYRGWKHHRLNGKQWLTVTLIETISIIALFFVITGLSKVSAIQSALILQTRPIFITLAGLLILNENIQRHEWIGLLISVVGTTILLFRPFFLHSEGLLSLSFIGTSLLLFSNLINTSNVLLIKKYYQPISKTGISGVHAWVAVLLTGAYLVPANQLPSLQTLLLPQVLLPVIYMGIFASIIGLTLSNYALGKIEASEATLFSYLQPLVYLPLTTFWLGETIFPAQLIGMVIIFIGVYYAERRPGVKKRRLHHGSPLFWRIKLSLFPAARPLPPHPEQ